MRTGWRAIAVLTAASLGAAAAAQNATPATPAGVTGEIGEADRRDGQGRRFDEHLAEFARGEAMVLSASPATASRLEPVIEIYAGDAAQPLARDAAEPGAPTARLSFTASEAGLFRVRILGGTAAAGRYVLTMRRAGSGRRGRGFSIGRPSAPSATPGQPQDNASPPGAPRSRFIICPGHPRCPR